MMVTNVRLYVICAIRHASIFHFVSRTNPPAAAVQNELAVAAACLCNRVLISLLHLLYYISPRDRLKDSADITRAPAIFLCEFREFLPRSGSCKFAYEGTT